MESAYILGLQITTGFYPLESLFVGAGLLIIYHLFVHLKSSCKWAQKYIFTSVVIITACLFCSIEIKTDFPLIDKIKHETEPERPVGIIPITGNDIPIFPQDNFRLPLSLKNANENSLTEITQILSGKNSLRKSPLWKTFLSIYLMGVSGSLMYLCLQFLYLEKVRKRSETKDYKNGINTYFSSNGQPFSYANNIFIPKDVDQEREKFIVAHERSHIKHHHYWKLLILQIFIIINWFNPFVWLFFKSTRLLQELEVDDDLLNSGYNREQYQINLVLTCAEHREWAVIKTNYNHSSLKKRILFMNKAKKDNKTPKILAVCMSIVLIATGISNLTNGRKGNASDMTGCWGLQYQGDSAFTNFKTTEFVPHYKFIGHKSTLTLALIGRREPGLLFFSGNLCALSELSDSVIVEGRSKSMIHQIDNQHFDLTWKDNNQIASNPWRTERWKRSQEPEEFRKVMAAYDECQERTDCFKGAWRIIAYSDRLSGDLIKVTDEQYKFYGKDRYFIVATRWGNQEKSLCLISGNCGTFEYVNSSLIRERGQDFIVKWLDADTYGVTFNFDGLTFYEIWARTEVPERIDQLLECTRI